MRSEYENPETGKSKIYHIQTSNQYLSNEWAVEDLIKAYRQTVIARHGKICDQQSSMQLVRIESVVLKAVKWDQTHGGSYQDLPPLLVKKTSILNIRNKDNRCFGYCLVAYLLELERNQQGIKKPLIQPRRPYHYYPHFERFALSNIQYPVSPRDIPTIEDQLQIKINIFSFFDELRACAIPLLHFEKGIRERGGSSLLG